MPRLTVSLAAGAILGGTLESEGRTWDIEPGFAIAASASVAILDGSEAAGVFALASAQVAFSFTSTTRRGPESISADLRGRDLRVGVAAGRSIGPVNPYLAARLFTGGLRWMGREGGEAHHYQAGLGASLRLGGGFDLLAEAMPLGERSFTGGVGWSF